MTVTMTVAYPNEPGVAFDEKYYCEKHMPLVESIWSKFGLTSWSVESYKTSIDGTDPVYRIAAVTVWKDEESVKKAVASADSAAIMEDIPKYTQIKPVFLMAEEVARSK